MTRIVTDSNGRKHITTEPLLHPPQNTWADLTRNEILELLNGFYTEEFSSEREIAFARVIQRALKEKNNG